MRRVDIINSALKLKNLFTELDILRDFTIKPADNVKPEQVMEDFQKFSIAYSRLTDLDIKILHSFSLHDINSSDVWFSVLASGKEERIAKMRRGIIYILEYLPQFVEMLSQDDIEYFLHNQNTEITTNDPNQSIITLILPENKKEYSNPERLIQALECMDLFYNVYAEIYNESNKSLSVIAIDSGSDKSFDFLGLAKIVTSIKELIITMWDRIVFYRELKMEAKIDLVAKSLPVLEQLSLMEKNNTIGKEKCQILKNNIFDGVNKFISSGALLPELDNHSSHDPRKIMAAEQKLLSTPTSSTVLNDVPDILATEATEENSITQEDMALLKKILDKGKKADTKQKSSRNRKGE